jgi:hypothetical protein
VALATSQPLAKVYTLPIRLAICSSSSGVLMVPLATKDCVDCPIVHTTLYSIDQTHNYRLLFDHRGM